VLIALCECLHSTHLGERLHAFLGRLVTVELRLPGLFHVHSTGEGRPKHCCVSTNLTGVTEKGETDKQQQKFFMAVGLDQLRQARARICTPASPSSKPAEKSLGWGWEAAAHHCDVRLPLNIPPHIGHGVRLAIGCQEKQF
jgi:hypothetical protein